jgi:hypothetical protein
VGQSVLVSATALGSMTRFVLLSDSVRVSCCGVPSLTRGLVRSLQLLLGLPSTVIFGPESRGTNVRILLSKIQDSPNIEGQIPVFISPRNRVAQLYPQGLGSLFVACYDSQGHSGGIQPCLHAGEISQWPKFVLAIRPWYGSHEKHYVTCCLLVIA